MDRVVQVLVVGGTGAAGRRLREALLERGIHVRMIGRFPGKRSDDGREHPRLTLIRATPSPRAWDIQWPPPAGDDAHVLHIVR